MSSLQWIEADWPAPPGIMTGTTYRTVITAVRPSRENSDRSGSWGAHSDMTEDVVCEYATPQRPIPRNGTERCGGSVSGRVLNSLEPP